MPAAIDDDDDEDDEEAVDMEGIFNHLEDIGTL